MKWNRNEVEIGAWKPDLGDLGRDINVTARVKKQSDYVGFPLCAAKRGRISPGEWHNIPTDMQLGSWKELGFLPLIIGLEANAKRGVFCNTNMMDVGEYSIVTVTLFNTSSKWCFDYDAGKPVGQLYYVKVAVLAVDEQKNKIGQEALICVRDVK